MSRSKENLQTSDGKRIVTFDLLDYPSISLVVDNISAVTKTDSGVAVLLRGAILRFLCRYHTDTTHLSSLIQLNQFYEACKRRYDDLSTLCSSLLSASEERMVQVNRVNKDGELKAYLLGRRNRKVQITIDEDNVFTNARKPGSYSSLFKVIPEIIELLNQLLDAGAIEEDQYWSDLRESSKAITSIAKVFEDLRGGPDFIDSEYNSTIERVSKSHHLDKTSKWYKLYQKLAEDIETGKTHPRFAPRYIRDIVSAIPKSINLFDHSDFHVSFKKTGTRLGSISLPGLYASAIEVDKVQADDELIGYTSQYNKSPVEDSVQYDRKSILIPQHKLPLRLIHMASNPIQDRCTFYHNRMMDVLNRLTVDCTSMQAKGITFALRVSNPKYRVSNGNNIYCLDINKATDTLNSEFQEMCITLLFGSEHARNWSKIVSGIHKVVRKGKVLHKYTPACGQPQGYKSSFPAFAWVHHVVMRLVMLEHGLKDTNPVDFYRVLGDDSIISHKDENLKILETYREICQWINWEINDKGYVYKHSTDNYAFAEFAKVRVRDGEYFTPIPIRLLLKAHKSPEDYLCYSWWCNKYYHPISLDTVLTDLCSKFPSKVSIEFASAMRILNAADISMFADFTPLEEYPLTDEQRMIVLLSFLKAKIRQTLMHQFIPDSLLTEQDDVKDKVLEPFFGGKIEKTILNLIESTDHKLWKLWQENQDLINILGSVFGSDSPIPTSVIALGLSPEDRSVIYTACEMLMDLEGLTTLPESDHFQKLILDALNILSRYNPRSDVKTAKTESLMYSEYCSTLLQYIGILQGVTQEVVA